MKNGFIWLATGLAESLVGSPPLIQCNDKPHFDLLKPPPKFYRSFHKSLIKLKYNIGNLQKENFTAKAIYTTLEQQSNLSQKAENHWGPLGHNVTSWAAVWNSCFVSPSLGQENDISFLISHCVVKTGTFLKYTWHMTKVNEYCTMCNASEDIECLFLYCPAATRVSKHFLLLLNKVLPFKATRSAALLLLRIFPVKVDRKFYFLALYLIKLILYQIWITRCSYRIHQKLVSSSAIIKRTETAIKQRITTCFQAHSTDSAKQIEIWRAKDALCTLDTNNQLTFKF